MEAFENYKNIKIFLKSDFHEDQVFYPFDFLIGWPKIELEPVIGRNNLLPIEQPVIKKLKKALMSIKKIKEPFVHFITSLFSKLYCYL
jgi:hypothetical protein